MVGNLSGELTLFPFPTREEIFYENGVTPTPLTLPVFPSHPINLSRSLFPSGGVFMSSENVNNDVSASSLRYSSPGTVFGVLVVFSVCTILGNSLVMLAVFREHYLKSPPNYFVASLAAADFSVGVLLMPFEAITQLLNRRWIFGDLWCDLWHSFDVMLTTASILNLCVISLDRYWAICTPLQYSRRMTPQRAIKFIALVWICAIMISLPAIFWWRMVRTGPVQFETCPFTDDVTYLVSSSCISFYFPLSIMLFAYYKIYLAAVRQSKSIQQGAKLFSSHDKNGTGDITLRMHRGGGGGNGGNNGNNNTICGRALASHRKSFHFVRSDPTGLPFLGGTGLQRASTVKVRKTSCTTYFMRSNAKERRKASEDRNGKAIVPILLMSDDDIKTEVTSVVISPPNIANSSSSSTPAISSPLPSTGDIITGNSSNHINIHVNPERMVNTSSANCNHHHLIPNMSFRRHSRRSFTVARKIAKFAKEKKAAKTLAIVLGVFIICWLPFFVINIVFALCKSCAEGQVILFEVATWLGWFNSACNPAIYACWSGDFRRAFARLLCCGRCFRARQRRKTQRRLSVV